VLDVACGAGAMTRELERPGRLVVGVDISTAELELAQHRSEGPWVRGDALQLPFADESLDAVVSSMGWWSSTPRPSCSRGRASAASGRDAGVHRPDRTARVARGCTSGSQPGLAPADVARFPGPLEFTDFAATLRSHGMRKYEDGRERYRITIHSRRMPS